ncbi:MAG: tetratricopeptide repeat protein [Chitinophagales bacterium]|nr:tetratricopeptide repeat protein [Chitinophagales bacterium]
MEENEFMEPSESDLMELVSQYEEAEKTRHSIFLDEDSYDCLIQFYHDNREYSKALRAADAAIAQYPFSAFFYTKKAEILANQRKFDEALPLLDEAERLDPNDINIFLIRSDVYLWEGRHEDAMEVVEHAMTIAKEKEDRCELFLETADIWEDQEKYNEVINCLKNALREDPMSEEALNRLWFCTELTENFEDSIQFHEMLIEESPYSHLAWFNLGHAYAGLGMYEKALDAFGYVMAIDEEFDPAYISTGDVLFITEEYTEALQYYHDAIRISKPNKELYLKTAACYEQLNELVKSRAYLRKAIGVDPQYDEAFFRIGETYRLEDNWGKAIHSYERAVKLNKENIDYLSSLAEAYLSVEDCEAALEVFERIFQLDPQSKQHWINLATAYFNVNDFRKTFQVLNEAELKYEGSADIFYIKSVFYNRAGNRHEALLNLERGLLADFDQHNLIFEMDDLLLDDAAFIQTIEQYRE